MKTTVFAIFAVTGLAVAASAQQVSTYAFERKASADQAPQVLLDKVLEEQGMKVALERRVTTNAPYSAEATNESIQLLPDGNRIVHQTTTRVYRDSAGRTRRETLDDNGQVILISVNDPTTGNAYVFDPRNNTTSRSMVRLGSSAAGVGGGTVTARASGTATVVTSSDDKQREERAVRERVAVGGVMAATGGGATSFVYTQGAPAKGETTKEDLGQQTIEGVTATGTRTTTVIPAGAIGNDQPIKIVSEEWSSPELQVLVLTKHNDPRTGETTYRLTGITRTEPARALFEMPEKK